MFRRPGITGLLCNLVMVVSATVSLVLVSAGTAAAASTDPTDSAASSAGVGAPSILGMPLGTLSWALLGLVILVSGLVAASRSGQRAVATVSGASASSPSTSDAGPREVKQGPAEPLGDLSRPVTVI